jgi:hypothetical protein
MPTNNSIRNSLHDGLVRYRLPQSAVLVYLVLLEFGPHTKQALLQRRVLAVEDIDSALATLRHVLLIGEQQYRSKVRYYATNPRIAWRWQEFRFIWDRVLTLTPVDAEPPLEDDLDRERLRLLRTLRADAVALFDLRRHSLVEDGRGRALATEGEYAQACAEIISLAQQEIVAVDRPPYTTATLPVFWSAITDRRAAGVAYRRYVPLEEMLLHGLDVVTRDIEEVGIDLHIVDPTVIRQRFYLVDGRFLLIKFNNQEAGQATARLSYDKHKIQRFKELAERTVATAQPARDVLPAARRWANAMITEVSRRFGSGLHERITQDIARMGKFAQLHKEHLPIVRDLVATGVIIRTEEERYALAPPPDRDFAAFESFR